MDVGRIISMLLEREGITGTRLSEISGVAQNMISDYKRNVKNPRFRTFVKIINAIGYELLVKDARGKLLRCNDFGVIVEYILIHEELTFSKLEALSGVNDSHMRQYTRKMAQPTMCVADRILASVEYQFKIRKLKEKKDDQN